MIVDESDIVTYLTDEEGNPILADTLFVQYGNEGNIPKVCTKGAHLFTYSNVCDLGDTAWAYNNKKNGVRLYWGEDTKAFAADTASAFGVGQLALAGISGLLLGIAGAMLVFAGKRRKEEPETP